MNKNKLFKACAIVLSSLALASCASFDVERMAFNYGDNGKQNSTDSQTSDGGESAITYKTPTKEASYWQDYTHKQFYTEDFMKKTPAYQFVKTDCELREGMNYDIILNLFDDGEFVISQYSSSVIMDYYGYWANVGNSYIFAGINCYRASVSGSVCNINYTYNLTFNGSAFDTFGLNLALGFAEGGVYVRNTDISGDGSVIYKNVEDFETQRSLTRPAAKEYTPAEGEEEKEVLVEMTSSSANSAMTLYVDNSFEFSFKSSGGSFTESGTWALDGDTLSITIDGGETITATLASGVYTLEYVAKTSSRVTATFTCDASAIKANTVKVLFTWGSTSENYILTFNSDCTYHFEFKSYSLDEDGTWSYSGFALTLTNSAGKTLTPALGEDGTYTLDYVSGVSDRVTRTFTLEKAVWEATLGTTGTYYADANILFVWGSTSENYILTFNKDCTYHFEFKSYSLDEDGTWSYSGFALTLTNSAGKTLTPALGEDGTYTLDYVSGVSDRVTRTFTLEKAVWEAAFGTTGTYSK